MLHGETPSDAMQGGFDDIQQAYLDTAELPGPASEERATAENVITKLPVFSSSVSIVAKTNASIATELEDFLLGLERDAVAEKVSRGGIINISSSDDCFGVYMSYIDADLPIFPVLFDPLSRDNRPAASCLYFDSSVDLAAYMGEVVKKLSAANFNPVYPVELLTLRPADTAGSNSQYVVSCDDLIEALGWPRPETPVERNEHEVGSFERSEVDIDEIVAETSVKNEKIQSVTTTASKMEEEQQLGSVGGKAVRLDGISGDRDLPAEELPEFEPVIEGNENNQFCGFCGFDWQGELLSLRNKFFGAGEQWFV